MDIPDELKWTAYDEARFRLTQGDILMAKKHYPSALDLYMEVYSMASDLDDYDDFSSAMLAETGWRIGYAYEFMNRKKDAKLYFEKTKNACKKLKSKASLSETTNLLILIGIPVDGVPLYENAEKYNSPPVVKLVHELLINELNTPSVRKTWVSKAKRELAAGVKQNQGCAHVMKAIAYLTAYALKEPTDENRLRIAKAWAGVTEICPKYLLPKETAFIFSLVKTLPPYMQEQFKKYDAYLLGDYYFYPYEF